MGILNDFHFLFGLFSILCFIFQGFSKTGFSLHLWLTLLNYVFGDNRLVMKFDSTLFGCDITKKYSKTKINRYITFQKGLKTHSINSMIVEFLLGESEIPYYLNSDSKINCLKDLRDLIVKGESINKELFNSLSTPKNLSKFYPKNQKEFPDLDSLEDFVKWVYFKDSKEFDLDGLKTELSINNKLMLKVRLLSKVKGNLDSFNIKMSPTGAYNFLNVLKEMEKGTPVLPIKSNLCNDKYLMAFNLRKIIDSCNNKSVQFIDNEYEDSNYYIHESSGASEVINFTISTLILGIFSFSFFLSIFLSVPSKNYVTPGFILFVLLLQSVIVVRLFLSCSSKMKFYLAHLHLKLLQSLPKDCSIGFFGILRSLDLFSFCPTQTSIPFLVKKAVTVCGSPFKGSVSQSLTEEFVRGFDLISLELEHIDKVNHPLRVRTQSRFRLLNSNNVLRPMNNQIHQKFITIKGSEVIITLNRFNNSYKCTVRYQPSFKSLRSVTKECDFNQYIAFLSILEMMSRQSLDCFTRGGEVVLGVNYTHEVNYGEILELSKNNKFVFYGTKEDLSCGANFIEIDRNDWDSMQALGWNSRSQPLAAKIIAYTRNYWGKIGLTIDQLKTIYTGIPKKGVINKKWFCELPNKRYKIFTSDLNFILKEEGCCIYRTTAYKKSPECEKAMEEEYLLKILPTEEKEPISNAENDLNQCGTEIIVGKAEGGNLVSEASELMQEILLVEDKLNDLKSEVYRDKGGIKVKRKFYKGTFNGWCEENGRTWPSGRKGKAQQSQAFNEWRGTIPVEKFEEAMSGPSEVRVGFIEERTSQILTLNYKVRDLRLGINEFVEKNVICKGNQKLTLEESSRDNGNFDLIVYNGAEQPEDVVKIDIKPFVIKYMNRIKNVNLKEYKKQIEKKRREVSYRTNRASNRVKLNTFNIVSKSKGKLNAKTKIPVTFLCETIVSKWREQKCLKINSRRNLNIMSMSNRNLKYIQKRVKDELLIEFSKRRNKNKGKNKDIEVEDTSGKDGEEIDRGLALNKEKRKELRDKINAWNKEVITWD